MFTQLIRIGRDAELRYTQDGKAVCSAVGAYDIGWGDNKKTQWIDCVIWGDRAEKLAPYIIKGKQFMVTVDDVQIETFESKGVTKAKLKGRVIDIKFCGPKDHQQGDNQAARQPQHAQQNYQQSRQPSDQHNSDFDEIPI